MQILHIYKTYLPEDFTGIPRVIHAISKTLSEIGVESHVLTVGDNGLATAPAFVDGHYVHRAKRDLKFASTDLSWRALGHFRELVEAADVVHYHFPWPAGDLLYWLAGRGTPAVVTYHSDIIKQRALRSLYAPLMHRFLGAVESVVATSPNYLASSQVLRRHSNKVSVIPLGLGPRPPLDMALVETCRVRVGEGFFLFLGTMRYYKGIPFLIEAARRTGFPVVLAGAPDPAFLKDLPANVKVLGEVTEAEKEALLELSRALILPSHLRSEAFGLALIEAARAGRPLISCEIGTGTSYVNIDQQTGIVVPPAKPEAMASAMGALVADPDAARAMGQRAKDRFATNFTAEQMSASYLQLYHDLIDRSRRNAA